MMHSLQIDVMNLEEHLGESSCLVSFPVFDCLKHHCELRPVIVKVLKNETSGPYFVVLFLVTE